MSNIRQRVLVVDDDADTRELYRWVFETRGFDVEEAENGAIAVALAHAHPPDLVLLDNDMPVMTGLDAARALRADPTCAAVPILMLSGDRAGPRDAALCDVYARKPCTAADLLRHARALLRPAVGS